MRKISVVVFVAAIACDKGPAPAPSASAAASAPAPSPSASIAAAPSASAAPSAAAAPSSSGPPMNGPPSALFADVTAAKPLPIRVSGCDEVAVTFVSGKGSALGETLGTSDVLLAQGEGSFEVKGAGTAVVGRVMPKRCAPSTAIAKKVVRASAAKDLAWAGGAMHARLDLEGDASPNLYVGRLEGTAPVAEHTHPGAWEILCAVEGAGIFTLQGRAQRVGPHQVVVVPPDTPHSWQPDAKAKLVAVQMYTPPGPEQRFKKLAADAADAGK